MAKKHPPFHNLEASVGRSAANKNTDVMLVQFFLSELAKHPDFTGPKPSTPQAVNGVCSSGDPNDPTQTWIRWFQNFVKSHGCPVIADGRVDPLANVPVNWPVASPGMIYTIMHLNGSFRKRYKSRHDALDKEPAAPPPLRDALKTTDFA